MITVQALRRAAAVSAIAVLTASCASPPQLDAQWSDRNTSLNAGILRSARVLVACDAYDLAVRQICQDQLSAEVVARGATAINVTSDTGFARDGRPDDGLFVQARAANAGAVLIVVLTPATNDADSGFSLGIGGFGFGRNSAVGGGVTAPIGNSRVNTGFAANGRVTDAKTGRLAWTATAVASPSADLAAQFASLSRVLLDSAERAGLF